MSGSFLAKDPWFKTLNNISNDVCMRACVCGGGCVRVWGETVEMTHNIWTTLLLCLSCTLP